MSPEISIIRSQVYVLDQDDARLVNARSVERPLGRCVACSRPVTGAEVVSWVDGELYHRECARAGRKALSAAAASTVRLTARLRPIRVGA